MICWEGRTRKDWWGHTSVNVDELKIEFHEDEINQLLKVVENKSRVFIRRHVIHATRFDILDENGTKLFQVDRTTNFPRKPWNYKQNWDPHSTLPRESTNIRFRRLGKHVVSSREHASLKTPKFYPLSWELVKTSGVPNVHGRIEERRLIVASTNDKGPSDGRRSIPLGQVPTPNSKRISTGSNNSPLIPNSPTRKSLRASLDSTGADGKPLFPPPFKADKRGTISSAVKKGEKPKHDQFCCGFETALDYTVKILMIIAHFLVNDDFIRQNKRCKRMTICTFLTVFLGLGLFGLIGGITFISLT